MFDTLSLCTGCIFGYIAMEITTYATVMNTNRPGLWPCHLIYLDNYEMIYKICAWVHHYSCVAFSEGLCRSHFGLKYEDLMGSSYLENTIYCISNTTEHILTKFGLLFNCMDSACCVEDGFICMCIFMDMKVCFVQRGCATTTIIPSHKTSNDAV